MSGFVVDTSVVFALLLREADAEVFRRYLDENTSPVISTATLYEAHCVAIRNRFPEGARQIGTLMSLLEPDVVAFDLEQFEAAREAYSRYGRGSGHRAKLNMGDCFAYALAKTRRLPLLFKGDDFIHTDIASALKPA